jgi:hypothetical protein
MAEAWLDREPLLALTPGHGDAPRRYRRYVEAGLRQPDDAFVREVAEASAELDMAAADLRRRRRDGTHRALAALALVRRCGLTERAAAHRLGLGSGAAVSYLIRRIKERARTDTVTAHLVESVGRRRG